PRSRSPAAGCRRRRVGRAPPDRRGPVRCPGSPRHLVTVEQGLPHVLQLGGVLLGGRDRQVDLVSGTASTGDQLAHPLPVLLGRRRTPVLRGEGGGTGRAATYVLGGSQQRGYTGPRTGHRCWQTMHRRPPCSSSPRPRSR